MNTTNERYETDTQLKAARLEKVRRETALLELRIAEAEGRLLDAGAVQKLWSQVLLALRQQILALPLPEIQRREILESLVEFDIVQYCRAALEKDDHPDDDDDAPPAPS